MGSTPSVRRRDSNEMGGDEVVKWREDQLGPWNEQASRSLKSSILTCVQALQPLNKLKIIVCGGTSHGKSSLINNCLAALSGIYAQVAQVGRASEQVTQKYKRIESWDMEGGSVRKLPLVFYDTRGVSDSTDQGAPVAAIKACIMGKVACGETIDLNIAVRSWKNRQQIHGKVSYIFFVADATEIPEKCTSYDRMKTIYQNLRRISDFAKKEDIQVAAFVTKCDLVDPDVKRNTSNLHYSKRVECKVKVVSEMVNIPVNRVFPVANYTEQIAVTSEMQIQTLLALKACVEDIVAGRVGELHTAS